MPAGYLQFTAKLNGKATLWEGKICPEDPELDFMMRLLRAEALAVQQEKAFQALTMAVLGATVSVSGDDVSFWTAEGQPLRAPVLEKLLVTPTVERAVVGITQGWRDGIADELRQMTLQRGNRRAADPRAEAQVANQISVLKTHTEQLEKVQSSILDKLATLNRAVTATDKAMGHGVSGIDHQPPKIAFL